MKTLPRVLGILSGLFLLVLSHLFLPFILSSTASNALTAVGIGLILYCSLRTAQRPHARTLSAALAGAAVVFVASCAWVQFSTPSELAAFFQTGTSCTKLLTTLIPEPTTRYTNVLAENICYETALKEQVLALPYADRLPRLRQAAQLFQKHERLTSTDIILILAIDVMSRTREKKEAKDAAEKYRVTVGLITDILELTEILPKSEEPRPGLFNQIDQIKHAIDLKLVQTTVKHAREAIEKLRKSRAPARAAAAPDALDQLSERARALQSKWGLSDEDLLRPLKEPAFLQTHADEP